uniref:Uncharacterized protein n=1 Tax=Lactuca sativa TaxID=4236 RepID=A0A9R1W5I6_LACSA|nr:hypothetical protein LSAT_V11C300126690 [Lactuca sativa]
MLLFHTIIYVLQAHGWWMFNYFQVGKTLSKGRWNGAFDKDNHYKFEASILQKIKELQEQLDMHILREVDLERNLSQSRKEINSWYHKEVPDTTSQNDCYNCKKWYICLINYC